jgi:hypothetical protein
MRVEMESFSWAPAHCEALREYVTKGLSFAEAAREINRKFGTDYTRSAAIGRARRMGLAAPPRPQRGPKLPPAEVARPPRSRELREAKPAAPSSAERPTSGRAIAATRMAATRTARPSPSAAIRVLRARATAGRIFT